MAGPRLTRPAARLVARSISTTTAGSAPAALRARKPVTLQPEYAALLKGRNVDADHPRGITTRTANLPHPPPRKLRLMQTFAPSRSSSSASTQTKTVDSAVLPSMAMLQGRTAHANAMPMPLAPDSFGQAHQPEPIESRPGSQPEISVVAAHPDQVVNATSEDGPMTMDGVQFKFAHSTPARRNNEVSEQGMLRNVWQGMEDLIGQGNGKLAF